MFSSQHQLENLAVGLHFINSGAFKKNNLKYALVLPDKRYTNIGFYVNEALSHPYAYCWTTM